MSRSEITISKQDAEKIAELLEGFSLILRSAPPDRLVEALKTLDQTGVYQPLRYEIPIGPGYVADEANAVLARVSAELSGGGS